MTTGQLIKAARKSAKMTQAELADKLGIPYQSVSQWERDTRKPKYDTIKRIADAMGVDWISLVDDDESMKGRALADIVKRQDAREFERLLGLEEGSVTDMEPELREGESIISTLARTDDEADILADILDATKRLNPTGQYEARKRVEELTEIPRYRAETAPQSPPAPPEGTDTAPPPDAPETPPDGE